MTYRQAEVGLLYLFLGILLQVLGSNAL